MASHSLHQVRFRTATDARLERQGPFLKRVLHSQDGSKKAKTSESQSPEAQQGLQVRSRAGHLVSADRLVLFQVPLQTLFPVDHGIVIRLASVYGSACRQDPGKSHISSGLRRPLLFQDYTDAWCVILSSTLTCHPRHCIKPHEPAVVIYKFKGNEARADGFRPAPLYPGWRYLRRAGYIRRVSRSGLERLLPLRKILTGLYAAWVGDAHWFSRLIAAGP